jgi:hypothetical protein
MKDQIPMTAETLLDWIEVTKTGCMEWCGPRWANGYGYVRVDGVAKGAHRVVWEMVHGPIPDDSWVLHGCDNRPCVNPYSTEHLHLGTAQDNSQEMVKRGRASTGDKNGSRLHPDRLVRGSSHPQAKLTEDDVRAIRQAWSDGTPQHQLARTYGVAKGNISFIVRRKTWLHVE